MKDKVIAEKRLDEITKNGEKGFFVPIEIFNGEDCIIILSVGHHSGSESFKHIVSKAENNILVYTSKNIERNKPPRRTLRKNSIALKVVKQKSPLYKSINKSLDEVIAYRTTSKDRPKTIEKFLDEL